MLDLSESYLIENIQNKPLQKLIMKYIKLKDSDQSDENLNEKINILSGLKITWIIFLSQKMNLNDFKNLF